MRLKSCTPVLSFTAFVAWLLAVPMDGPLPAAMGLPSMSFCFLSSHIPSLLLLGRYCSLRQLQRIAPGAIPLTIFLTAVLPFFPAATSWLALLLGFGGAPVAILSCRRLSLAQNPMAGTATGLIGANIILFLLLTCPPSSPVLFSLIGIPLLCLLRPAEQKHRDTGQTSPRLQDLWLFLPFVLLFHLVSGLTYGVLYPAYLQQTFAQGLELVFYIGTIGVSAGLIKSQRQRELSLVGGILLAMLAFSLLQHPFPLTINLSMYGMQAAQGLVDLFLIAFLLSFSRPVKAFGFGLATLCLGIIGGQLLGKYLHEYAGGMAMSGLICLNLAALSLYFYRWRKKTDEGVGRQVQTASPVASEPAETVPHMDRKTEKKPYIQIPDHVRLQLSEREMLVLEKSFQGFTYRDIASRLKISESSVKTYMKRIYDKLGIHGRRALFEKLSPGADK